MYSVTPIQKNFQNWKNKIVSVDLTVPFPASIHLSSSYQQLTVHSGCLNFCQQKDSNQGLFVSDVIALPTEPQQQSIPLI